MLLRLQVRRTTRSASRRCKRCLISRAVATAKCRCRYRARSPPAHVQARSPGERTMTARPRHADAHPASGAARGDGSIAPENQRFRTHDRLDTAILCDLKSVSYTHLRAHETRHDLVCRLLLEKK